MHSGATRDGPRCASGGRSVGPRCEAPAQHEPRQRRPVPSLSRLTGGCCPSAASSVVQAPARWSEVVSAPETMSAEGDAEAHQVVSPAKRPPAAILVASCMYSIAHFRLNRWARAIYRLDTSDQMAGTHPPLNASASRWSARPSASSSAPAAMAINSSSLISWMLRRLTLASMVAPAVHRRGRVACRRRALQPPEGRLVTHHARPMPRWPLRCSPRQAPAPRPRASGARQHCLIVPFEIHLCPWGFP